ncbi:MAG: lysozyme [Novosphingobium sp.]
MTSADPRQPAFDAIRAISRPGLFNDPGNVLALDNLLDAFGAPRMTATLQLGPEGETLIKKWEGYKKDLGDGRVQSYPDPATGGAPWTIGWGSTGPDVKRGTIWTREKAQQRFASHIEEEAAPAVRKGIGSAPTAQRQFDAMVSLAYNIGVANFLKSTLLRKHVAGDYSGAQAQFAVWNKAAGKVMQGLTNRRADEAKLYGSK